MLNIPLLGVLACLCLSHSEAVFSSISVDCEDHNACSSKKCEFGIIATCVYGRCVCDMDIARGHEFMHDLHSNIEKYFVTHYARTSPRHKRSMTFDPQNRLSKKVADTITFEESKVNKRSVRSMSFETRNRLSKKLADTITFEEARLNKRSARGRNFVITNKLTKRVADSITFEDSRVNKRSVRKTSSTSGSDLLRTLNECNNATTSTDNDQQKWTAVANSLSLNVPVDDVEFFREWNDLLKPFTKHSISPAEYIQAFPKLPERDLVAAISSTDFVESLFWPFNYDLALMNQKLALLGLTGEQVPTQVQKSSFYAALNKIQGIDIPVVERKVAYSFDSVDIASGLIHFDALSGNSPANMSEKYMFNSQERKEIIQKTDAAFDLIAKTMPDLYKAINQLVGCIAFYKAEDRAHISGSMNSAIGVIWFDPSATVEWTVPFYAEQIVHEYIHTALYTAELVHGMFNDYDKLHENKVMSSIRLEPRDYDKSFHACYVSTGLVAFHAKAGFWTRAQLLGEMINGTLEQLVATNEAADLLTPAGKAMLDAMKQYVTAIRLI